MIQAIIFDFDGLMIDTETPDYQVWQEIFTQHGCILDQAKWSQTIGSMDQFNPYDDLERQLRSPLDRTQLRLQRRQKYLALARNQPIHGRCHR